jgi:hypothetical protein
MITPLDPPATDAVAAVAVAVPQIAGFVMSKDMMHPVFRGQPMGAAVWPLAATLRKILSVAPFMNSVTGEHSALAVAICGPSTGVPSTPAVTGICHTVVAVVAPTRELAQTYRFPVPLAELK